MQDARTPAPTTAPTECLRSSRRRASRRAVPVLALAVAALLVAPGQAVGSSAHEAEPSFVDPTAQVVGGNAVELEGGVYVGPFAELRGGKRAPITLGAESNVQDNVVVDAATVRPGRERAVIARAGLRPNDGVETGERVILAHGSSVRGPARLGVGAADEADSGVFVSFGAQVDGAVIERDSGLSVLSRVGPGVTLRSGLIVLPGKNVTTQAQADDPALGKVRPIVEADRLFNEGVVEVNVSLAREYSRLEAEDASAVRGINVDPGNNVFDQTRDAPRVASSLCTGPEVVEPEFRNRIIGDVCFEDTLEELDERLGEQISLRADEGGPFAVGEVGHMHDGVVFHALEGSDLSLGSRIGYGAGAIVHGGGRPTVDLTTGLAEPTVVGNDVTLGAGSTVFRSLVRNEAVIGERSAVVGSELVIGQVVPPRTIYANDAVFGPVEW